MQIVVAEHDLEAVAHLGVQRSPPAEDFERGWPAALADQDVVAVPKAIDAFVAIDFEIANSRHDSACAVGLAACSRGRVVQSRSYLIRPPGRRFTFTGVHGLTWEHVRTAPSFTELWPVLRSWLEPAAFIAAHNAHFDQNVLRDC